LKNGLARFLQDYASSSSDLPASDLRAIRRLSRRWDDATIANAVSLYKSGRSAASVAAELGCSKSAMQRLLTQKGVMRSRPQLSEWQLDEAARLYRSGKLLRELGERYGVSRDYVRLALKRRGVVMRRGTGARRC
jgi:hypothetical protein